MVRTRSKTKQGIVVCSNTKQSEPPGSVVSGTPSDTGVSDVPVKNTINKFNIKPFSVALKDICAITSSTNPS